ncbi:MAG: anaerobic ribonucleoside triphosphate reductase [Synergistaceae bacterium]|jgi:ribonucleoside-triphosphate reductase|nr:anaerobic ribonucleoside triphosphate reductase [Synergistaceae bacterium]
MSSEGQREVVRDQRSGIAVTGVTEIVKRDGRRVAFKIEKISNAIFRAMSATGEASLMLFPAPALDLVSSLALALARKVAARLAIMPARVPVSSEASSEVFFYPSPLLFPDEPQEYPPQVEDIQDVVERVLIEEGYVKTAKAYILYRAQRSRARETRSRLMNIYENLTFKEAQDNDLKRENANIDGDTAMGTMLRYGSEGAKYFNEIFVLKPEHSAAHKEGDIHIHDMDFLTLTTTCCQIDLLALFKNGFSTGNGFLREPNDIRSYAALACIAIQANQNDQHGGQSVANFDYDMAPGVAKTWVKLYRQNLEKARRLLNSENIDIEDTGGENSDVLERVQIFAREEADRETDRATYQAMEALVHNLNTMHSRAGAQVPFSSLNYGTDTSPEGRIVTRNLLLAMDAGLGKGETPIFPVGIFKVKEGINYRPEDPNYDLFRLACKVSAKRLFPNFAFLDAPFNLKYYRPGRPETEVAYMGCRTRVVANVFDETQEVVTGRGNLSFTTINLPRLTLKSDGNEKTFFRLLDEKIDLVVDQLFERFKVQAKKKVKNFPFLMGQKIWLDSDKLDWDDEIGEVLRHGTLSMGFIGLAECLKALTGKHHGESTESQALGLKIVGHMRERMDAVSLRTRMNYTLLATPAEGTAGRFVKIDRTLFGMIDGVTDRDYYTNSFHIPVYHKLSAWDKIHLEAPYHELTNAGHITYVEMDGDPLGNLEAFEKIVRAMKEAGVGYGSINHPVDRDPVCGYTGIIGDTCPSCGRADGAPGFERIRRITGYLVGTLDRFNDAKKAEERDRVKHGLGTAASGRSE